MFTLVKGLSHLNPMTGNVQGHSLSQKTINAKWQITGSTCCSRESSIVHSLQSLGCCDSLFGPIRHEDILLNNVLIEIAFEICTYNHKRMEMFLKSSMPS